MLRLCNGNFDCFGFRIGIDDVGVVVAVLAARRARRMAAAMGRNLGRMFFFIVLSSFLLLIVPRTTINTTESCAEVACAEQLRLLVEVDDLNLRLDVLLLPRRHVKGDSVA